MLKLNPEISLAKIGRPKYTSDHFGEIHSYCIHYTIKNLEKLFKYRNVNLQK